eukprot:TRINITY_DN18381_c0_g2_i1.p1 TRINITY_DN18381_c0_g2~~TRINITY_DN18381_c0_g2_i1.p1  ORF type:complete len:181 (+),score=31.95 TRINITY_DN18381_c0_g2_i1:139-681(+)
MLLPLPSFPVQYGPPSQRQLKGSPLLVLILTLQILLAVACVVFTDVLAGLVLVLTAAVGCFAWCEGMNITWVCVFGAMCLINGVFDTVRFVHVFLNLPLPMFSDKLPFQYNMRSATLVGIPMVELLGAWLAWWIYSDHENAEVHENFARDPERASLAAPVPRQSSGFQTFAGPGRKLGDD